MYTIQRTMLCAIALLFPAFAAVGSEVASQTIAVGEFEASEILPITQFNADWDEAYWLVGDEKELENNLRVLMRAKGTDAWQILPIAARLTTPSIKTDDSEALCRRDGYVYIVGSHFGKKQGPLELDRQFIARFKEPIVTTIADLSVSVEVGRIDFEVHRIINDALKDLATPVVAARARTQALVAQLVEGLSETESHLIHPTDLPINIEGAVFLDSGELLVGLRFPVNADGHPILVQLSGIDDLFTQAGAPPIVTKTWVLDSIGNPRQFMGVRAMAIAGDSLDLIAGGIERTTDKEPPILIQDYLEGAHTVAMHVRYPLEAIRANRPIPGQVVRTFTDKSIEGVASTPYGERYVADLAEDVELLYVRK